MLGMRSFWRSGTVVLASTLICAASLASASASVVHYPAGVLGAPAATAKRLIWDQFGSVSCVPSPSTFPYDCEATGWYLNGHYYSALAESTDGTGWYQGAFVPRPPRKSQYTYPNEVSCASVTASIPRCLFVGEHYNWKGKVEQLAEWGNANNFAIVDWRNPPGTTWSGLDDVSCPTSTFCVAVGFAGEKRYTHGTWFTWNGTVMREKTIPEPPHSHNSELGGLSCSTTTNCVAVGNYQNPAGKWRSYAEIWANGKWTIDITPNVRGQKASFFEGASCPSSTECVAVGLSSGPGSHAFAEVWNGVTWSIAQLPARSDARLIGVSCPSLTACFAVGSAGKSGLAEMWNGVTWSAMAAARTGAPTNADAFLHVSCVSPTSCVAVGWRYDPRVKYSSNTLAEVWNGVVWKVQKTIND
jgi:hypothetical protein